MAFQLFDSVANLFTMRQLDEKKLVVNGRSMPLHWLLHSSKMSLI